MERFNKYINMLVEMIIMTFIYLIILPFRIIYSIGNRLTSK